MTEHVEVVEDKADEKVQAETKTKYLEFVGQEPYGTEFYGTTGTHTVYDAEMKKYYDVSLGRKEAVWKRGANGRFLVPEGDLSPEAVEVLANDPLFKRVEL